MNDSIVMTRKQLYTEIWEISVAGVARKYNLSYSRLIKQCREEEIPFPSSGYWTRRNLGKDVSAEIIPLKGDPERKLSIVTNEGIVTRVRKRIILEETAEIEETDDNNQKTDEKTIDHDDLEEESNIQKNPEISIDVKKTETEMPDDFLSFLEEEERIKVWNKSLNIKTDENAKLHRALVQYKKRDAEYKEKLKKAQSAPYYNPSSDKPKNEPEAFKEVSNDGIKRAAVILNALFRAVEQLGGTVHDDLSVTIRKDKVGIRVAEGQDKVKHELTKQEANAVVKYNDEVKRNHWASKPKIKQYDYFYNGRLRIIFDGDYIRDSNSKPLEKCLGDMLICLYKKSEEHRIEREKREERERKWQEERKREEEQRERKAREVKQTIELENMAEDYRTAEEIRAFIRAKTEAGKATEEWIRWAKAKADWYDPLIAAEDVLLGKREHGKSKEDKRNDMTQKSRYWSW